MLTFECATIRVLYVSREIANDFYTRHVDTATHICALNVEREKEEK